jgi:chromosome segregation ATPase
MLMALMVLVGFGILFMYASDDMSKPASRSIESIIAEQNREITNQATHLEELKNVLSKLPERVALKKALVEKNQSIKTAQEKISALKTNVESNQAEIAAEVAKLEGYKDKYRAHVRGKAKGQAMDTLTTRNGTVYKNVNIREVTPIGIQIRHDEGHKRIAFEELSDELVDYYQYDSKQKEKALKQEMEARANHEAEAAHANVKASEQLAQQQAMSAEARKEDIQKQIVIKESQMRQIRGAIRDLQAQQRRAGDEAKAAKSSGKLYMSRKNTFEADIQSRRSQIEQLTAEVSQLQSSL